MLDTAALIGITLLVLGYGNRTVTLVTGGILLGLGLFKVI